MASPAVSSGLAFLAVPFALASPAASSVLAAPVVFFLHAVSAAALSLGVLPGLSPAFSSAPPFAFLSLLTTRSS